MTKIRHKKFTFKQGILKFDVNLGINKLKNLEIRYHGQFLKKTFHQNFEVRGLGKY
jgi:hypothetical protein